MSLYAVRLRFAMGLNQRIWCKITCPKLLNTIKVIEILIETSTRRGDSIFPRTYWENIDVQNATQKWEELKGRKPWCES